MEVLKNGEKQDGILYTRRDCCYGIVEKNGHFLLVYSLKDDNFSFPGGGMEHDEKPYDTICREFLEESGYTVLKGDEFVNVYSHLKNIKNIYLEKYDRFFTASVDEKNKKDALESWHETLWVKQENVRDMLCMRCQKMAFDYYLENIKGKVKN